MYSTISIESIPWIFKQIIPTQLEVDGIKFPLTNEINLGDISKSYGHYRIRLVYWGLIKAKALVIDSNKTSIKINFKFQNNKWSYLLISIAISTYSILTKPQSILSLAIYICLFLFFLIIDLLFIFVEIQETNPPSR